MNDIKKDSMKHDLKTMLNTNINGSFNTMLFKLIAKSDLDNRRLIAKVYPDHVNLWNEYLKNGIENL